MWAQISAKIGKQKTYYIGAIVFMLTLLSTWFLPEAPHIAFLYVVAALCGLGYGIGKLLYTISFFGNVINISLSSGVDSLVIFARYYWTRRIGNWIEARRRFLRNFCSVSTRRACHGKNNTKSLIASSILIQFFVVYVVRGGLVVYSGVCGLY